MRGGRSGRRPDLRRRAAGLAPPPSLLHDSPVSSAEGREQSEPPSPHRHPSPASESSPAGRGVLLPTPNLSRLPCRQARQLSGAPEEHALAPLDSPRRGRSFPARAAAPRPPAPRAHRLSAHRSSDDPRALHARALRRREGRRGRQPGFPPPSHSRPARRPTSPRLPAAARSQPRAFLPEDDPHILSAGSGPPGRATPRLGRRRRAAPPPPCPPALGPRQNVCAPRRRGQSPGRPQLPGERSGPRRGGGGGEGWCARRERRPAGSRSRKGDGARGPVGVGAEGNTHRFHSRHLRSI